MRDQNGRPRSGNANTCQIHDDFKRVGRKYRVHHHADQAKCGRDDNAAIRHMMLVHTCGELRTRSGHSQRTQRTTSGIQASIQGGKRRGEHHNLNHIAGMRNANAGEERDERGLIRRVGGVWQHQRHKHHGTHIEHENANNHRINGLRQHLFGILRLTGRHANHFSAAECEHHAKRQREHRSDTIREQTAIVGDIRNTGVRVANRSARNNRPNRNNHERDNRGHLNGGKPEFRLAEHLHTQQIQHKYQCQRAQGDQPLRHPLERLPIVEIHGNSGDISHNRNGPVQEEQPAGHICALLTQEFAGIRHERARRWTANRKLTQRANHQERENTAHRVCDRKTCAALRKTATSAQKQAGANGTANRDHLNMTRLQILRIARVTFILLLRRRLLRRAWRGIGITHSNSSFLYFLWFSFIYFDCSVAIFRRSYFTKVVPRSCSGEAVSRKLAAPTS